MSTSSPITTLASGQITPADTITVELIQPPDLPAMIRIAWPLLAAVCDPRRFPEVAAVIARLFAETATTLARIKASKRL